MREILCSEGIQLNCVPCSKKEAIERAGRLLYSLGYVEKDYIESMFKREEEYDTYLGNGVAIPHGCMGSGKYIKDSGIVICQYKEPIDYNGNRVFLVIGIAGKNNTHLELLGQIAVILSDMKNVEKICASDSEEEIMELIKLDGQEDT